ncbi:NAD(P)H-hydrate dehydratase [Roseibium algae]|uniref:Bifunctional NAD(P)H-hydrate repair enzyme n=1 Tax=Roseibium algae TaxID=3123038 RepID=A0ABU8TJK7_9HYPH
MMKSALLTPAEMKRADEITIDSGVPGIDLMECAGDHVARLARDMCGTEGRVLVVCGPGNNGGDGFVAAQCLQATGRQVDVVLLKEASSLTGDAAIAYSRMGFEGELTTTEGLRQKLLGCSLVIDALFGAGLSRPLQGEAEAFVSAINESGIPVLSVDLPSGLNGETGQVMGGEGGCAIRAERSVTFFRHKPGHYLIPGRVLCGRVDCVDIGIRENALSEIGPTTFINGPDVWSSFFRVPQLGGHKYDRGHAVIFGGPMMTSGAGRLAAGAALRAGAGLVTLVSPPSAVMANATQLTAVMLKSVKEAGGILELLKDPRLNAALIGPGYGLGDNARAAIQAILESDCALVLDADALTNFQHQPTELFDAIHKRAGPVVMTPHDGEFARLFPDLMGLPKLEKARQAALRSGAVLVLKGADTVIASPDGRAVINENAPAWLATAGSGDVLAGIVCAALAQKVSAFEAASMAVWLHGAAGAEVGPGLIAEDLVPALRLVIAKLVGIS